MTWHVRIWALNHYEVTAWLEGEQHGGMLVKRDRLRDVARLVRTACGLVGTA